MMDGYVDGWNDGGIGGWMGGRMDRWMDDLPILFTDLQKHKYTIFFFMALINNNHPLDRLILVKLHQQWCE